MIFPFELTLQICGRDWDKMSKKEKLNAIAWAMESILMSSTEKMTGGEEKKLQRLNAIRKNVLKDGIKDME